MAFPIGVRWASLRSTLGDQRERTMRHLFAASILAISAFSLAACNEGGGTASTPASTAAAPAAADPDAVKKAVDEALAARDAEDTKIHADAGPGVYFVNLRDGETVSSPF